MKPLIGFASIFEDLYRILVDNQTGVYAVLSPHYRLTRACTLAGLPVLSCNVQRTDFTTKNFLNALFLFYIADFEAKQNCEAYARKTNTILTLS